MNGLNSSVGRMTSPPGSMLGGTTQQTLGTAQEQLTPPGAQAFGMDTSVQQSQPGTVHASELPPEVLAVFDCTNVPDLDVLQKGVYTAILANLSFGESGRTERPCLKCQWKIEAKDGQMFDYPGYFFDNIWLPDRRIDLTPQKINQMAQGLKRFKKGMNFPLDATDLTSAIGARVNISVRFDGKQDEGFQNSVTKWDRIG